MKKKFHSTGSFGATAFEKNTKLILVFEANCHFSKFYIFCNEGQKYQNQKLWKTTSKEKAHLVNASSIFFLPKKSSSVASSTSCSKRSRLMNICRRAKTLTKTKRGFLPAKNFFFFLVETISSTMILHLGPQWFVVKHCVGTSSRHTCWLSVF